MIRKISRFNFYKNLEVNQIQFALIYSLLTLVLYHQPLFAFTFSKIEYPSFNGAMILLEITLAQFAAVFTLVILFSLLPKILKIFCIILLFTDALAFYFVFNYNVILDKTMIDNLFNTNLQEAGDLFSLKIIFYLILFGLIPSLFIAKVKIKKSSFVKKIIAVLMIFSLILALAFLNSKSWLWLDKNAKRIGGLTMPFSYIGNSIRYYKSNAQANQVQEKIPDAYFVDDKKNIVILVIGESARKANFSLYGYQRATNPLLAKDDVVTIQNAKSCTTYTTESIKCMLSYQGSKTSNSKSFEFLPHYLERSDINVLWRSNNWGAPQLKITHEEKNDDIRKECKDNCKNITNDEILLYNLDNILKKNLQKNNFIVLHQSGSHGPLYYEKYPQNFEIFKPVCKSVELQKCSKEELVNAYDNTIIYNDYFLHKLINILRQFKKKSITMIYISDHGESLGEYKFYLHGTPYKIAPDFQKEIPFIIWMSDEFKKQHNITSDNIKSMQQGEHSQDNIFPSIMGAFGLRSDFYDKELDIFSKKK